MTRAGKPRQLVESRHYGHLVVVGPDGRVIGALGDPDHVTFLRSTAKPFQAAASLELAGDADLPAALVAVGWSSHRAEPAQLEAVRDLLAHAGFSADDLTTPPAEPADEPRQLPSRLAHNCSGKHALFALAGRAIGCPRRLVLDPDGPLQRAVLATLAQAVGPLVAVSVDGCGAPAAAASLAGLAHGYAALAESQGPWARIADAGRAHPDLVGGKGRLESELLKAGIVAKPGAEGVFAAGWTACDGEVRAAALKITDGASRGSSTALHGLLAAAGLVGEERWSPPPVLGGERPVGGVVATRAVTALGAALAV
ncbi:MAG: asparaginase [Actinomycetota bacterium]|nr:asparaginase [Actinomycetota bacterium]